MIDVENNDEPAFHLAHTLDEVCTDIGTEGRGRLDLVGRNIQHLVDRIDHDADDLLLALELHLDDDYAGTPRNQCRLLAEARAALGF